MKIVVVLQMYLFASTAFALSADEMVLRADRFRMPQGDLVYMAQVSEFDGSTKLRETKYKVAFQPPENIKIETRFPERSMGRNFLMIGNDMWLQTPDLGRPTRISFQQKLTGEVSNGDLARTQFAEDYHAEVVGEEKIGKRRTKKLLLKGKNKDVTYAAAYYWVDAKTFQPVQAEFLTAEMKVLKRGIYKRPEKIFGRAALTELELIDGVNKSRRSVLRYSDFKRTKFKDGAFNKESLKSHDI